MFIFQLVTLFYNFSSAIERPIVQQMSQITNKLINFDFAFVAPSNARA